MTKDEFQTLKLTVVDMLCGEDLIDKTPRTLLYGHGAWFRYVHTYFDGENIRMCGWDNGDSNTYEISPDTNGEYIPDDWVRPEYCDLEFCQLLLRVVERIPFGDWGNEKQELRTL